MSDPSVSRGGVPASSVLGAGLFEPVRDPRSCYHEAGHALASVQFGEQFQCVRVFDHGPHAGGVLYRGALRRDEFPYFRDQRLIALLAGPAAEARFTGSSLKSMLAGGGSHDYAGVLFVARDDQVLIAQAINQTCLLIARYWSAVGRIAEALALAGALDWQTTCALVRKGRLT